MRNQMEEALRLIAKDGCERVTSGWCGDGVEDWSPYAQYGDDKWCQACIARSGLDGSLPQRPICIDADEVAA